MRKFIASALSTAALAVVPLSVTGTPAVAEPDPGPVHGPIAVAVCKLFQQLDLTAFDTFNADFNAGPDFNADANELVQGRAR